MKDLINGGYSRRISWDALRKSMAERDESPVPKTRAAKVGASVKPAKAAPPPMTEEQAIEAFMAWMTTPEHQRILGLLLKARLQRTRPSLAEAGRQLGYRNRGMFSNLLAGRLFRHLPQSSGWTADKLSKAFLLAEWQARDAYQELHLPNP